MPLIETVLGNSSDPVWQQRLADAELDVVELSQWDAQKSRLRKETQRGTSLAISLARGEFLHTGDILLWDAHTRHAVVCKVALCEVLVIDLHALASLSPDAVMERAVRLGHALGNQHWPAVVKDQRVYVPVTVDRKVVDAVMRARRFEGIAYAFLPGEAVAERLDGEEARHLFGGSERPSHAHHHDHRDHEACHV